MHKRIESGYWLATTPVWVYRPAPKEERWTELDGSGSRKLLGIRGRGSVQKAVGDGDIQGVTNCSLSLEPILPFGGGQ